jgi:hypothetical protein
LFGPHAVWKGHRAASARRWLPGANGPARRGWLLAKLVVTVLTLRSRHYHPTEEVTFLSAEFTREDGSTFAVRELVR